jgi:serine O-acetyltransferase
LRQAPELTSLILGARGATSFEDAVARRVASRLADANLPFEVLHDTFCAAFREDVAMGNAMRADIRAVVERDPAAGRVIDPLLFFKGFHAIETHRLAHWLWLKERRDFALYLQCRSSEVFQTDIHPAAFFGRGIFLDHATGFVVGATAVLDDDISILHDVTLGGTGKAEGDRHPKIRSGVLIGAGAKILGPIEVGRCARVAAGSVVMSDVAPDTTVAGVPAKAVGMTRGSQPSRDMEQMLSEEAFAAFDYVI